ncbi:MAG: dTDP-4-dehydrorhamnose 3,5-epimerase [Planctomycetota bacterium]
MKVEPTPLPGVLVIEPAVHGDARGFFLETFQEQRYLEAGVRAHFVQDNHSHSQRGVLRGLHYQLRRPQAKLVHVLRGEVFDVALDIRRGSPTFGQWFGTVLSESNHRQLYIPPDFAHGFCVLSDHCDFLYKCSDYYVPDDQCGIAWDDPGLGIDWQVSGPTLSPKDLRNPRLSECPEDLLPIWGGEP